MKKVTDFSQKLKNQEKGFTLVELLVVIGILAILLAIVLIAINPAQQFQQANDTQRRSDINAILNSVHQHMADEAGALPDGIDGTEQNISNAGVDLCQSVVPDYIADLPMDPDAGTVTDGETPCDANTTAYDTGYTIQETADGRITVRAPEADDGAGFTVTR